MLVLDVIVGTARLVLAEDVIVDVWEIGVMSVPFALGWRRP